ncbi:hypothetical protein FA15DRAFT_669063 [Coprinopsis marcescibilis]|uniref:Pali-domain-containing protein n=1 Tax=Coprinopsis marcescibilis TaxID=230819 RepID=A0A5C3KXI0_COPMA|nr:hypothetical protein FA15DRAFT_669063 [Coprinopsis marcescibilis]
MPNWIRYPGVVALLLALVASFLASISLPYLTSLDVTRVDYVPGTVDILGGESNNLRFGIWTACSYSENERTCLRNGIAYVITVTTEDGARSVEIGAAWTRGLVLQPVATAATLIALCLSLASNLFVQLLASLLAFFAALVHLISFAIQIALFAYVKNKMDDLEVDARTRPGAGFWLVFASLILTLLAGCTVCFGRRSEKRKASHRFSQATVPTTTTTATPATHLSTETEKPKSSFLSRFRRNKV